jgi:hypothetical protein
VLHKRRNVLAHLPQGRHAHVAHALSEAWNCDWAELARRRRKALIQWLERNGEDSAAASLRAGLEEKLSVVKFDLPVSLRGFLLTTNAIENLIGSVRRVTRSVTRWRSGDMIARWSAVGLSNAEPNFPRIRGYRHLPILARALHHDAIKIDQNRGGGVVISQSAAATSKFNIARELVSRPRKFVSASLCRYIDMRPLRLSFATGPDGAQ